MNIDSLTSSVIAASRRARAAAAASLTVLALGMTALLAPTASAATPVAGDFSPLIQGNPSSGWLVDDCSGDIGFIYDRPSGWSHIGGVRINCSSRHNFISATVALYYFNGSTWVQYGSGTYGVRYNSTGSGTAILKTPAYCEGTWRGWWAVGATVSTERATRTVFSEEAHDPASGPC